MMPCVVVQLMFGNSSPMRTSRVRSSSTMPAIARRNRRQPTLPGKSSARSVLPQFGPKPAPTASWVVEERNYTVGKMDQDEHRRPTSPGALSRRLHSEIDPAFFSTNFRPMMQLVSILSAEARGRGGAAAGAEDAGDAGDDGAVRVFTLDGSVVSLVGLDASSTVDELRGAVKRVVGADFEDQRLYVNPEGGAAADVAVSRLELLNVGIAASPPPFFETPGTARRTAR